MEGERQRTRLEWKTSKRHQAMKKSRIHPPQSEEHKGPLAACLISTHPLKSRADRTRTHTHPHTPIHVYIRAHGKHAIGCRWRGWGGPEPHRCVFNGGEEVKPRGSDPTDSRTTPRSAHVKMNEILPLCWPLTWLSISCNVIILKKVLKKILRFQD